MSEKEIIKARVDVKHPYLLMMGLYLGAFIGMFSETSLNIALPSLMEVFGVDSSIAQWLVVGYMLIIALVLPFASLLMKLYPTRNLTMFALGIFMVGALLSGFAPNFALLLIGRLMQGVGTGLILPMMFAIVLEVFPSNKIGQAMGVTSLIIMFAPAIGPTLSGIILGFASWRILFLLFALILFIAILFTYKYAVNPYTLTKTKVDTLSCISSCLGFGGVVLGAGLTSMYGWLSWQVLLSLVIGVVSLIVYCKCQLSMENPILNLRAFQTKAFRVGTILIMLNFGITLSAMYILPQYLQNGLSCSVTMAGLLMLPAGIVNALFSLSAGKFYDKKGAQFLSKLGLFLSVVGVLLFLQTTKTSSFAYVIMCHIIVMIGVPLAMSPCQSYGLNALSSDLSTDGSTIQNMMQQVFGAISTAVSTSLLGIGKAAYIGNNMQDAFVNGVHYAFMFTLVIALIGFVFSFQIKENKK